VLHITLHELGDYEVLPRPDVVRARQLAETVDSPAFELVLKRAMTFLRGPYVLLVGEGLEQILALEERICIVMKRAGWPLKKRLDTPHMSLSYNGHPAVEHMIEPIRWHVDEFVLINSHSGETHHKVVGTWPLRS
jgi:2'-5' RNA ligase